MAEGAMQMSHVLVEDPNGNLRIINLGKLQELSNLMFETKCLTALNSSYVVGEGAK